jgi:hypothetical protein
MIWLVYGVVWNGMVCGIWYGGMIYYSVVWYGELWYGMVSYGMRYGMVWCVV